MLFFIFSYQKNAKITSNLFKDRPMSPQETVVYWTEYVIRHNGAHHLKSETLNLAWYQYVLLDVIFCIIISFLIILYLIYTITRFFHLYIKNYLKYIKIKQG